MTDAPMWPLDKLSALRLGRRLAVEVPASGPQRRAFEYSWDTANPR